MTIYAKVTQFLFYQIINDENCWKCNWFAEILFRLHFTKVECYSSSAIQDNKYLKKRFILMRVTFSQCNLRCGWSMCYSTPWHKSQFIEKNGLSSTGMTSLMIDNGSAFIQLCPSLTSGHWTARPFRQLWCRPQKPDMRSTSAFCAGTNTTDRLFLYSLIYKQRRLFPEFASIFLFFLLYYWKETKNS